MAKFSKNQIDAMKEELRNQTEYKTVFDSIQLYELGDASDAKVNLNTLLNRCTAVEAINKIERIFNEAAKCLNCHPTVPVFKKSYRGYNMSIGITRSETKEEYEDRLSSLALNELIKRENQKYNAERKKKEIAAMEQKLAKLKSEL